jgi:hypothetical protein
MEKESGGKPGRRDYPLDGQGKKLSEEEITATRTRAMARPPAERQTDRRGGVASQTRYIWAHVSTVLCLKVA